MLASEPILRVVFLRSFERPGNDKWRRITVSFIIIVPAPNQDSHFSWPELPTLLKPKTNLDSVTKTRINKDSSDAGVRAQFADDIVEQSS